MLITAPRMTKVDEMTFWLVAARSPTTVELVVLIVVVKTKVLAPF